MLTICVPTQVRKDTVEEEKLIKSFVAFWLPKLESLEIERVTQGLINIFASSTSLNRIRCDNTRDGFSKLVRLESLSVKYKRNFGDRVPFFDQMAAQVNLKKLEVRLHTEDLKGLITLINAKRFDKQFQLATKLWFESNRNANTVGNLIRQELNLDVLKDFVCSVANSSSSIRLTGLTDFF